MTDKKQGIIDSRDLQETIDALQSEIDGAEITLNEETSQYEDKEGVVWDSEVETLESLKEFATEFEGYAPDYRYGEAAIRDTYFKEYAQELASDIGAMRDKQAWPLNCIDWEKATRELQMDYSSIDFDGVTYWVRGK